MGKLHDLIVNTDRYKASLNQFFLDMTSWKKFTPGVPLTWERVQFGIATRDDVPQTRGLYVFTLESGVAGLPQHGYILYVGITGNTSAATLRSRYAQYLRHLANEDGRPLVYYMLAKWSENLIFNFVPVPDTTVDLAAIEKSLLDSVMPPVNTADFDADILAMKKAAF